jgi:hypothetical protein
MSGPELPWRQSGYLYGWIRTNNWIGLAVAGAEPFAFLTAKARKQAPGIESLRVEIGLVDHPRYDDSDRHMGGRDVVSDRRQGTSSASAKSTSVSISIER